MVYLGVDFKPIYSEFHLSMGRVRTPLPFTAGGRFPRARPQPRANTMLVMKAVRQDVATFAFHP